MAGVLSLSSARKRHGAQSFLNRSACGACFMALTIGLMAFLLLRGYYYQDATSSISMGYSSFTLTELAQSNGAAASTTTTTSGGDVAPLLDGLQTLAMKEQMLASCPELWHLTTNAAMNQSTFVEKTFHSLLHTQVNEDPLFYVAANFGKLVQERGALANGFWAEFGVFRGDSLTKQHDLLRNGDSNGIFNGIMAGFDSFQGLPEDWRSDKDKNGKLVVSYKKGSFHSPLGETRKKVPQDVLLYPGWFQDSIGQFATEHPRLPASFIHHDGDLFVSTTITFQLLSDRIVPGTIMCFDELFGYPGFKDHEILALFLWMKQFHATLCPLAAWWPDPKVRPSLKDNNMAKQARAPFQAACFQVLDVDT